ncbi:MAG: nicotinate (nicotinamide) nucleotide adenylyltransferase [Candidatus Latescibacteria bacterium]|nr:nicotinate (nicotinamide) nucleotide adenylyltransferase [Candidatus Latescibacterota bacterium]
MRRLGILGGTFDPIHIGHLLLAQFVRERMQLDQVLLIPAADPPHKEAESIAAPAADRWAMVELGVAGLEGLVASRLELDRQGKSYTYDTLRQLQRDYPGAALFLIIGADNMPLMSTWYKPREILDLCTVVAGSRLSDERPADPLLVQRMVQIDTPVLQLSSTSIRQRLEQELPIRYMVPESVEAYIREQGLYWTAG